MKKMVAAGQIQGRDGFIAYEPILQYRDQVEREVIEKRVYQDAAFMLRNMSENSTAIGQGYLIIRSGDVYLVEKPGFSKWLDLDQAVKEITGAE